MSYIKNFYERSRLEIICKAICVAERNGVIVYGNKYFRALSRMTKSLKLKDYSEFTEFKELVENATEVHKVMLGRRIIAFASTPMRFYDETSLLYVDADACDSTFPVVLTGYIYYAVETLSARVLVPLLGGKVYANFKADNNLVDTGSVSDIGIKYFCVRKLLSELMPQLASEAKTFGYDVDLDPLISSNAVCLASGYDLALTVGQLVSLLISIGDKNRIMVSAKDGNGLCSVIVEIRNRKLERIRRISPEKPFANREDETRVIKSLCKLCDMYGWKLLCKETIGKLVFSVNLPIYNLEKLKFEDVSKPAFAGTVDEIKKLFKRDLEEIK